MALLQYNTVVRSTTEAKTDGLQSFQKDFKSCHLLTNKKETLSGLVTELSTKVIICLEVEICLPKQ